MKSPLDSQKDIDFKIFYEGIVSEKQMDKWQHNWPLILLDNKTKVYLPIRLYDKAIKGDSVVKKKSSFEFIIYRDGKKETYSYLE